MQCGSVMLRPGNPSATMSDTNSTGACNPALIVCKLCTDKTRQTDVTIPWNAGSSQPDIWMLDPAEPVWLSSCLHPRTWQTAAPADVTDLVATFVAALLVLPEDHLANRHADLPLQHAYHMHLIASVPDSWHTL